MHACFIYRVYSELQYVSAVEGYVWPAYISDTVVYLGLLPVSCVETSDDGMFWADVE
jgi:hypothetical protein